MVRAMLESMRNPLHIPSVLRDTASTIRAASPHAQKATEANGKALECLKAARDPDSNLSEAQRAALRLEASELQAQSERERETSERPWLELEARHPDWVNASQEHGRGSRKGGGLLAIAKMPPPGERGGREHE
jgi:hypothetical protein